MVLFLWTFLHFGKVSDRLHRNPCIMGLHLNEITKAVAHGAKCLQVPDNITLVKLPPYSPEMNPMENVWAYLGSNKLAISVFVTYEETLEKCAQAWNFFANDPERITSITKRDWIKVNY